MRTTLNIDDDLLIAVKEMAKREARPAGAVISSLVRRSLAGAYKGDATGQSDEPEPEFGFRPFPKRGGIVTNALIDRLREEADV